MKGGGGRWWGLRGPKIGLKRGGRAKRNEGSGGRGRQTKKLD